MDQNFTALIVTQAIEPEKRLWNNKILQLCIFWKLLTRQF